MYFLFLNYARRTLKNTKLTTAIARMPIIPKMTILTPTIPWICELTLLSTSMFYAFYVSLTSCWSSQFSSLSMFSLSFASGKLPSSSISSPVLN